MSVIISNFEKKRKKKENDAVMLQKVQTKYVSAKCLIMIFQKPFKKKKIHEVQNLDQFLFQYIHTTKVTA